MASTDGMAFRFRSWVVTWLPLLLLGTLALMVWQRAAPPPKPVPLLAEEDWISMDLGKTGAVDRIPGWDVRRGSYRMGGEEGRRILEQLPEPMVEGKVLWTRAMRGGGGVRARMQGDATRRAFPRFSVGLHQEQELHLRAFPGGRKLELVGCHADLTNEVRLASVAMPDWRWAPSDWTWLEFRIVPEAEGVSRCEGRLWKEGTARPAEAQLVHRLSLPPSVFYAALQGAPFALRSIRIDAVDTQQGIRPPF